MRRTRIAPVSAKRRARDRHYHQARADVYERSGGMCEVRVADGCTGRCEQVHHIEGRGGPDPHRLDNLIGVCAADHDLIHRHPAWARLHGFMRSRMEVAK